MFTLVEQDILSELRLHCVTLRLICKNIYLLKNQTNIILEQMQHLH